MVEKIGDVDYAERSSGAGQDGGNGRHVWPATSVKPTRIPREMQRDKSDAHIRRRHC
jgi:hypothetical protein